MDGSVLACFTATLVDAAVALGHERQKVLALIDVSEVELLDSDARISMARHERFWELPFTGAAGLEIGRRLGVATLGVVGFAARHCQTLGEALAFYDSHRELVVASALPSLALTSEGKCNHLHVRKQVLLGPKPRARIEAPAAASLAVLREITQQALRPVEVRFPLPAPEDPEPYQEFFGCPVLWAEPDYRLVFDSDINTIALPHAEPALFEFFARRTREMTATQPVGSSLSARVSAILDSRLGSEMPDAEELGRAFAMTGAALLRALAADGQSLRRLIDGARRRHAETLIARGDISPKEISYILGFSEPSAFFRAFRRWTGTAPGSWNSRGRARA